MNTTQTNQSVTNVYHKKERGTGMDGIHCRNCPKSETSMIRSLQKSKTSLQGLSDHTELTYWTNLRILDLRKSSILQLDALLKYSSVKWLETPVHFRFRMGKMISILELSWPKILNQAHFCIDTHKMVA